MHWHQLWVRVAVAGEQATRRYHPELSEAVGKGLQATGARDRSSDLSSWGLEWGHALVMVGVALTGIGQNLPGSAKYSWEKGG